MCGIVAITSTDNVITSLIDALLLLQHRGQDAAGVVTAQDKNCYLHKSSGLVRDVFSQQVVNKLPGNIGIGHVRYRTQGGADIANAQPFRITVPCDISLVHNGNLTNAKQLRQQLKNSSFAADTDSDSEILLHIFAQSLNAASQAAQVITADSLFQAVTKVHKRCQGAYVALVLIAGLGILAFRDPHGTRPLCFGEHIMENGQIEYLFASESTVLTGLGFNLLGDVQPGEAIFIDANSGMLHKQACAKNANLRPCAFEYAYLARADSIIDGISVYQARLNLGFSLANQIKQKYSINKQDAIKPKLDIDVVMPIPETSRPMALAIAESLNLPYKDGFIKNNYVPRTFIMAEQSQRKKSVRQKLSPINTEFVGKSVLLVDDSIVRGTTSKEIVNMVRQAGARQVIFASTAPVIRYPNYYGLDINTYQELVAYQRSFTEIAEFIGADVLIYQKLEDFDKAILSDQAKVKQLEQSVFDGYYFTANNNRSVTEVDKII